MAWKIYLFKCLTTTGTRYEFSRMERNDIDALAIAKRWEHEKGDRVEMFYPMYEIN